MTRPKHNKIPKATKRDDLHTIGKVVTSAAATVGGSFVGLAILGPAAGELYSKILKPPLAKRTEQFLISVYEGLEKLETKFENFNLQELSERPFFISAFMQGLQIALRNHQEEKLDALRNAIINIAKPSFPEDDVYLMFINWIDTFTPWHLKILKYLDEMQFEDDYATSEKSPINVVDIVINNFAELKNEHAFTNQIIRELDDHGLILKDIDPVTPLEDAGNTYNVLSGYTTQTGKKFLKFIDENVDLRNF